MQIFEKHLIRSQTTVRVALNQLNVLGTDAVLFVVEENGKLVGSLTDGDIRRGLIKEFSLDDTVDRYIQKNPKFINKANYNIAKIQELRSLNYRILPVLDEAGKVINVVNFRTLKSYLPIDVVIMAGGRGTRLRPMTDTVPKPLLKIGGKPIIEHNIERLINFGVDDFWISLRYLGEQIESYFGDGDTRNVTIDYIWEKDALGTIGAISHVKEFKHDYVLVTNSDILTNLDYESFFMDFIERKADLSVVSIPYSVDVPYAVLETNDGEIRSFKEKPTYTYYSNGGIYLMKRELIKQIPKDMFYNATDFLQSLIDGNCKVVTYPLRGYWLDIGKPEDFNKAQDDINHIRF